MVSKEDVFSALRKCYDPEINESVVDLGLIYKVEVSGGEVNMDVTMTTPSCPYAPELLKDMEEKVRAVSGVSGVKIALVWDPPWGFERMSEELRLKVGL